MNFQLDKSWFLNIQIKQFSNTLVSVAYYDAQRLFEWKQLNSIFMFMDKMITLMKVIEQYFHVGRIIMLRRACNLKGL